MRQLIWSVLALCLVAGSVAAAPAQITAAPIGLGGIARDPVFTVSVNEDGSRAGGTGSTSSPTAVQGNAASGAADSGNPVKMGCVVNNSTPTYVAANRGDCVMDTGAAISVKVQGTSATGADADANTVAKITTVGTTGARNLGVANYLFNGATWDRARGDTTGAYVVATPTRVRTQ